MDYAQCGSYPECTKLLASVTKVRCYQDYTDVVSEGRHLLIAVLITIIISIYSY